MATGGSVTSCACLRLFLLLVLRSQECAVQKRLRLCSACLVVFLWWDGVEVDKTIHYDLQTFASPPPILLTLSGDGAILYGTRRYGAYTSASWLWNWVINCKCVRCWFVKLWNLSGYSEKSNIQEAYLPNTSISEQIVPEILAQLCSDDSIQILLNLTWV